MYQMENSTQKRKQTREGVLVSATKIKTLAEGSWRTGRRPSSVAVKAAVPEKGYREGESGRLFLVEEGIASGGGAEAARFFFY